ncbi:MAG TPA: TraR/DksA C4-type zinc finger protein [Tissierellaceae bacterium]|nr:TraR/DksA C4-type zinc finger protein [Tissierellaceae bacterium]
MDEEKLKYFKSKLLGEWEKTMKDLEAMEKRKEGIQDDLDSELSTEGDYHPGDIGTELYMEEQTEGFKELLEEKLREIDKSLEDIEDGSYGYCDNCEEMISEERLEVMPYVKTCLDCSDEDVE